MNCISLHNFSVNYLYVVHFHSGESKEINEDHRVGISEAEDREPSRPVGGAGGWRRTTLKPRERTSIFSWIKVLRETCGTSEKHKADFGCDPAAQSQMGQTQWVWWFLLNDPPLPPSPAAASLRELRSPASNILLALNPPNNNNDNNNNHNKSAQDTIEGFLVWCAWSHTSNLQLCLLQARFYCITAP